MTSDQDGARSDQPVVVVTGGGGGIGAAVAEELGRAGWFVVTVDPLVSTDGTEQLPTPEETTAGRIIAAGGAARASAISVTDGAAVRGLFEGLVAELGRLDAVINVAGISRPTSFARGSEEDWRGVLSVHLDGYRNVLAAALPIMAAAGHGRILGVTSGSGWRQADTGAYGCAKRAVASLTWQLGEQAPAGVVVNAMSPIAMTRMVTDALARAGGGAAAGRPGGSAATGGLSLGSMPSAEELGPLGAHLVGDAFTSWSRGKVVFVGGSEAAVIDRPRLLEVVRTDGAASLAHVLEAVTSGALLPAEAQQSSSGGSNPRFASMFDEDATDGPPPAEVGTCAIVSDRPALAAAVADALAARGAATASVAADDVAPGFAAAAGALHAAADQIGPLDAVVLALAGPADGDGATAWERTLAEHAGVVDAIHADAGWARAAADLAAATDRPLRLVTLTDAVTAGGRSRAQASAQLARAARRATGDRVSAFAVSVEAADLASTATAGEVVAHLLASPETPALSGAELVVGPGWLGLRGHPRPLGSVTFGGPAVPAWFDDALRAIAGVPDPLGGGPPMTDRPTRVVDAHVHLWDPARTDWYPYLSGGQQLNMGDTTGMARRFDVPTYLAESAGWNVEKLVNVAAATGRHSIDETLELEQRAEADGHPDAIVGGLPPTASAAEAIELLDRQMAATRFRGVRPMGAFDGPLPAPEVLRALQERGLLFEVMAHPDQLQAVATGLEGFDDLVVVVEHTGWPRSATAEEHALWKVGIDALAGLGDQVVCKLSGLAMPLGSMATDAFAPWLEHAIEAFGVDRCLFASNFPVDGLHGTFDELYGTYSTVTSGLDAAARDKLFATNAERTYAL